MAMVTKRKAIALEGFNVLLSRKNLKLEKPILNIIEGRGVCVGETGFQRQTLRSKGTTHDKVRDALYEKINIIVEGKKKLTRGKASTAKYQLRRKMEQRGKLIKKLALWRFGTKMCTFGLMDSYKFKIYKVDLWTHGLMDS